MLCAYVCHMGSCVCECSEFCQGGGRGRHLIFLGRQFHGSVPLGVGDSLHVLMFLTAVLPAAVTRLKNLGPCDCSETLQKANK